MGRGRDRLLAVLVAALSGIAACDAATAPSARHVPTAPVPTAGLTSGATESVAPTMGATTVPGVSPVATSTTSEEPWLGEAPTGRTEQAMVVRVVDGDTIVVDRGFGDERVRYIGVDTPETVAPGSPVEWMGPEASAANRELVEGREVVLEIDVSETDRFGRLLRYVWIRDESRPSGWLFVNLELLARGFAQVVTYPPDVRYVDLYLAAQSAARQAGRGLWGIEGPSATQAAQATGGECHPSYAGACLTIGAGDYDCAGGNGNGPNYAEGPVRVVGPDEFRLDGDGDGLACE